MRAAVMAFCVALSGCAHLPPNLPEWSAEKGIRLAECMAQDLSDRDQAIRCLGRFAQSAGSEACKAADDWLSNLPTGDSDAD